MRFIFEKHADRIADQDLVHLFSEPPGYDLFVAASHHMLLGAKGSGKSALLRSVSLPVLSARSKSGSLPFLGVYCPLRFNDASVFSENVLLTGSSGLFEHYLSLLVIEQALRTLASSEELRHLTSSLGSASGLFAGAGDPAEMAARLHNDRVGLGTEVTRNRYLSADDLRTRQVSCEELVWTLNSFSDALVQDHHPPLCVLMDGYDHLCDELRLRILSLLRKEHSFCLKVAARNILDDPEQQFDAEWRRDWDVLLLDHPPSSPAYAELCSGAANAILNGESIQRVLDDDLGADTTYCGFDGFLRLSSGNVMAFLELCERAVNAVSESGVTVVPRKVQMRCAKDLARRRLIEQVAQDAQESFRELRSFIYNLAQRVKELPASDSARSTSRFQLQGHLPEPLASVLRTGFMYRHLLCSQADLVALNVTPGFLPQDFSLNLSFAPHLQLSDSNMEPYQLSAEAVHELMAVPTPFDPEYQRPQQPKAVTTEYPLFPTPAAVFISHPMGLTGERGTLVKRRITALKRAVVALGVEEAVNMVRIDGLDREKHCVSAHDIYKHSSPGFISAVDRKIRNARYVIHDITVPVPGVFFEMGLAAGHHRPWFLFFDESHEKWLAQLVPEALGDVDVKRFRKDEARTSFRDWVRQAFHNVAAGLPMEIRCPFDFSQPCALESVIAEAPDNMLFIAISKSNEAVRDVVVKVAVEEFDMMLSKDWLQVGSVRRQCALCASARACAGSVGLCDPGDMVNAFALGMLQGLDKVRLILSDRTDARARPPAMSDAQITSYTPSTLEAEVRDGVRTFLHSFRR